MDPTPFDTWWKREGGDSTPRKQSQNEAFKSDRWNANAHATHYLSKGGTSWIMKKQQLFQKLEQAWAALKEPGVMGEWSVKDILAHVTTWEEEALKYLPLILTGGRPPRYIQSGGIDAFNAQMAEQKRGLALSDVQRQLDETHRRLLDYIRSVPEEHFARETRFRHRLRLDTYSHYPQHAKAIRQWRQRSVE